MFKNILMIACIAMLAGCGGKKDENNTAAQVGSNGCPVGQSRDQYNNCVNNYNNGYYGNNYNAYNNCPVGQTFSATRNQCLVIGNCPAGQALFNNVCEVATNNTYNNGGYYPNGGGYPNQYPTQQCQQGSVFVAQFNTCLPMMQGCPQGWGYNQQTNLCYAPANYNPYTNGGGNGGFGFNWCFGTNCR